MDLNREIRIEDTKAALYTLREMTRRKYRRCNGQNRLRILRRIRRLKNSRELHFIEASVDEIAKMLHVNETPLDHAWVRKFKAFYGFEYVLKNGWSFLYDLAGE